MTLYFVDNDCDGDEGRCEPGRLVYQHFPGYDLSVGLRHHAHQSGQPDTILRL